MDFALYLNGVFENVLEEIRIAQQKKKASDGLLFATIFNWYNKKAIK